MKKIPIVILCFILCILPDVPSHALDMTAFSGTIPVGGSFFPAYEISAGCSADFNFTNYLAVTAGLGALFFLNDSSSGEPMARSIPAGSFAADRSFTFIMISVPLDLKFTSPCSDFYYFGGAAFSLAVMAIGTTLSGMSLDLYPYVNPFIITPRVGMGWRFGARMGTHRMFALELLIGYRVLTLVPEDALSRLSINLALSLQVDMDTLPNSYSFAFK